MTTNRDTIQNKKTQPTQVYPIFNNWDRVASGWYFVCRSSDLKLKKVKAFNICGNELAVYRGADTQVKALDAFCPHMGTHLAKGKVKENSIQCFFHHWKFDGSGNCVDVPCQKETPLAKVRSYQVIEMYKSIWVSPDSEPTRMLLDIAPSENGYTIEHGKAYERKCHHHVTMINGIDPQHLKTVHNLDIEMDINTFENDESKHIDFTLTGPLSGNSIPQRFVRFFLGSHYSYSMTYDHANNGFLTLLKNVHFFQKPWPRLYMIFAYRPISPGRTLVQPIFLTQKRKGILGAFVSTLLLWMTKRGFYFLQGEDGEVYDNMRFFPKNLIAIDQPVARFIKYVNKLKPSIWSEEQ